MTATAPIEVVDLTKRFGDVNAVDDLTFALQRGRVTGLLGPNGSGKTTTMRMIVGLVHPTGGSATINGKNYGDLTDPIRLVGAALESGGFHPGRTARDHLRVAAIAADLSPNRVDAVLEQTGISDSADRQVGGFSLGMRQRLALATALLGDPEILILDEPANGLDPSGIAWLRDFLRWRANEGGTVLISSHLLSEVAQTVDDVVIISAGRLVAHSALHDLLTDTEPRVVVVSPDVTALAEAVASQGLTVEKAEANRLVVQGGSAARVGEIARAAQLTLHQLVDEQRDLEDVYLRLIEGRTP